MADTIDITAGAGTTIATDDCAGTHYQVVKLADGTADQTAVIAADVGAKANALRVAPANDITDATYIGDIKFGEAEPNSAAIAASLAIIDDWDVVAGAAAATDGPQVMGRYDSTKPSAVDDGDAVQLLTDSYGRLLQGVEPQWFQAVYDSADATGEGEVVKASAASTKIVITSFVISSDVEGWAKLQDEDSNALTGKFWLKAGGGVSWTAGPGAPLIVDTADKDLEIIVEAAGNVSCTVWGYLIPG
jgi:hypothetical protein